MENSDWRTTFHKLYEKALREYRSGNRNPATYFDQGEKAFLNSIGCSAQELFDFAEDFVRWGEPDYATAEGITAIRREYFLTEQKGRPSVHRITEASLPAREAELAGLAWLPRILMKARARLRGELPPEVMYCCGGDREFLSRVRVGAPEFLRAVWEAGDDDRKVVELLRKKSRD